jgi:hypothetical protein
MTTSSSSAPAGPPPLAERRREPRIPVGIPASVANGERRVAGRVVDASEHGLLVELSEPLTFVQSAVTVALVLPESGRQDVAATVVRRAVGAEGRVLLALRIDPPARPAPGAGLRRGGVPAPPRRRVRPSRRAPPRPRPRAVAVAELRALGTRAYELAIDDPAAVAPVALVEWATRLAGELEASFPERPRAVRDLLAAICELSREIREVRESPEAYSPDHPR